MDLIGREREQREVIARLAERRLVTLIGPAGVGKTAVARAVAEQVGPQFTLGAHHVDLTRVDAAKAVGGTLAAQLGFGSFDDLLVSPTEQPALVIVDNCEHVTDAAADAISALLDACQSPTVLATSRSPLGLPSESLVVLGPLEVPPLGNDAETAAVRLFLDRARDAGATIVDEQRATVAELCRRLDGLPLALELAAAQTRLLQPAEILERLADGIDVLARPRFRGDARHRSLTATIEWSYRLLPADAAAALDRFGLFAGPFTLDLACAVAIDAGCDPTTAADAVQQLVDASLVVTDHLADTTRLRLLETVRVYAMHRLRSQGKADDAHRRLADHVAAAAAELLAIGGPRWDPPTLARLLALYDTIASTLRWCIEHDDDSSRALMLCSVLWGVVHQGHVDEVDELCQAALRRWPDPDEPYAADATATAATARSLVGDPNGALALAEHMLPHAEASRTAPVTLRRAMGYAARALDDQPRALALFTDVSRLARERGLVALALEADVTRAQLVAAAGQLASAVAMADEAHREAQAAGSIVNEVWAGTVAAHLRLRAGDGADTAEVEAALVAARRIEYHAAVSVGLGSLAWAALRRGDHAAAATVLSEVFDEFAAHSSVADLHGALYTTAQLLQAEGDDAWVALAATAASLPLVGLTGRIADPRLRVPDGKAHALTRREAIVLARTALRRVQARHVEPPTAPAPPPRVSRFADRGDLFEITFAGRTILAKKTKGLTDLAALVASPGREVHCLDLAGAAVDQGSTGAALDETARRSYEQRIRDLQEDMEQAEDDNDYARAERAQTELDALVEQLASALGLGGRARGSGSTAERARSAVTQRIRSTIRRLQQEHPELARHLDVSVSTGTYCAYRPEHAVSWET